MQTEAIALDPKAARQLYREYKRHIHYSDKIDHAIRRAYQLIAQGKMVIKALESIKVAGLDSEGLPRLAIACATDERCFLRLRDNGGATFWSGRQWARSSAKNFVFPDGSFPCQTYVERQAMVPIIPVHLRPKKALDQYHILWEAEWHRIVPKDPLLLRRIYGDMWLVVAQWDLTEVERAALATRIAG